MAQTPETDSSRREAKPRSIDDHDWHSQDYATVWMTKDRGRTARRGPLLQRMVEGLPFAQDSPIRVLDVGGGYGAVSEVVLRAFPKAKVTLQDYSQAMIDQARGFLAGHGARMTYALGDLTDRRWIAQFSEKFDLAVSAIAIHNLMEMPLIAASYRDIRAVLKPGGLFVDCDHFDHVETIDSHMAAMKAAGFAQVECLWHQSPTGILRARA